MKIIIDGTPKEIAALVVELQERQKDKTLTAEASGGKSAIREYNVIGRCGDGDILVVPT